VAGDQTLVTPSRHDSVRRVPKHEGHPYGFLVEAQIARFGLEGKSVSNRIQTQFSGDGLEGFLKRGVQFATAKMIEFELGAKGGIMGNGEANDDAGGILKGEIILSVMKGSLDGAAFEETEPH
jgi:hypothetical protein